MFDKYKTERVYLSLADTRYFKPAYHGQNLTAILDDAFATASQLSDAITMLSDPLSKLGMTTLKQRFAKYKYSQTKRKSKPTIQISESNLHTLKRLKSRHGFDSLDDTIDFLLDDSNDWLMALSGELHTPNFDTIYAKAPYKIKQAIELKLTEVATHYHELGRRSVAVYAKKRNQSDAKAKEALDESLFDSQFNHWRHHE